MVPQQLPQKRAWIADCHDLITVGDAPDILIGHVKEQQLIGLASPGHRWHPRRGGLEDEALHFLLCSAALGHVEKCDLCSRPMYSSRSVSVVTSRQVPFSSSIRIFPSPEAIWSIGAVLP